MKIPKNRRKIQENRVHKLIYNNKIMTKMKIKVIIQKKKNNNVKIILLMMID